VHDAASIARSTMINVSCLAACVIAKPILLPISEAQPWNACRPLFPLCADSDLPEDEKLALAAELKRTINEDAIAVAADPHAADPLSTRWSRGDPSRNPYLAPPRAKRRAQ
jgi:hypothetical protein